MAAWRQCGGTTDVRLHHHHNNAANDAHSLSVNRRGMCLHSAPSGHLACISFSHSEFIEPLALDVVEEYSRH